MKTVVCPICMREQPTRESGAIRLHMTVPDNPELGFCLGSGVLA